MSSKPTTINYLPGPIQPPTRLRRCCSLYRPPVECGWALSGCQMKSEVRELLVEQLKDA